MVEIKETQQPTNQPKNILQAQTNITHNSLTESLDTIDLAKILPCEKTEDILESVFDKNQSFGEPIDSILNKKFTVEGFLKSQEEEDALTDLIYKKTNVNGEDKIIFPLKTKKRKEPYIGKIGEQTSKYHKETVLEHIAMVVAGISKEENSDINMQLIGLLHDAGKKYTTGTNHRGELCFYEHEKVSAYLAAVIYRQLGFTKKEAEPYIRIIHDHMLPYNERLRDVTLKEKYRELYGDYITNVLIILNKSDTGITQDDESNPDMKTKKLELIEEGNQILENLKTEDFKKA